MFITGSPQALPGTCMMCPGSVRRVFIDTEIQIEWFGAVIICDECVRHMGRLFGMKTQEEVDVLVEKLAEKDEETYELRRQLAALEGVRDALAAGGWVAPDGAGVLAVPSASRTGDDGGTSEAGIYVGAQGRATSEPLHDEGLAELRSDERSNAGVLNI